ncbi:hypothetical protein DXT99_13155 [Pontibacter diazotrophicus]|uniref:Uncharacterized protein n=1 Tax=Pontibacter diazotrophicus TaxID=1400979 RepID=A0A3D8LBK0_9BACT|nr:hypothetical protein DXT99_13155 [Pontibacter diazotrophicus]
MLAFRLAGGALLFSLMGVGALLEKSKQKNQDNSKLAERSNIELSNGALGSLVCFVVSVV